MEEVACIECGAPTRVPRGTPPLEHTCTEHRGVLPPAVAVLRRVVNADDLARSVEHNVARLCISLLDEHASRCEDQARHLGRQVEKTRAPFDRSRALEWKGERSAYMEVARALRRTIRDMTILADSTADPAETRPAS